MKIRLFLLFCSSCLFAIAHGEYPCVIKYEDARFVIPFYLESFTEEDDLWKLHINIGGYRETYVYEGLQGVLNKEKKSLARSMKRAIRKKSICKLVQPCPDGNGVSVLKFPNKKNEYSKQIFFVTNPVMKIPLETPIRHVQIFGERCSGTSFLEKLLTNNLINISIDWLLGWKHFPDKDLLCDRYLEKEKDFLIIVIVRNLDDWLQSMHKTLFHANEMQRNSFSQFLRASWNTELLLDRAEDGSYQENVLALRAFKMKTFFSYKEHFSNFYFINYEVLLKYPEEIIADIASRFSLQNRFQFQPILAYKGTNNRAFKPASYPPISETDRAHILESGNMEIEKMVGY